MKPLTEEMWMARNEYRAYVRGAVAPWLREAPLYMGKWRPRKQVQDAFRLFWHDGWTWIDHAGLRRAGVNPWY